MKKTKFQLQHKRERNHRRPINKELVRERNKSFRFAQPKPFPKATVLVVGDVEIHCQVNKLGQLCQIQTKDPYVQAKLYGIPFERIKQ